MPPLSHLRVMISRRRPESVPRHWKGGGHCVEGVYFTGPGLCDGQALIDVGSGIYSHFVLRNVFLLKIFSQVLQHGR